MIDLFTQRAYFGFSGTSVIIEVLMQQGNQKIKNKLRSYEVERHEETRVAVERGTLSWAREVLAEILAEILAEKLHFAGQDLSATSIVLKDLFSEFQGVKASSELKQKSLKKLRRNTKEERSDFADDLITI